MDIENENEREREKEKSRKSSLAIPNFKKKIKHEFEEE